MKAASALDRFWEPSDYRNRYANCFREKKQLYLGSKYVWKGLILPTNGYHAAVLLVVFGVSKISKVIHAGPHRFFV